MRELHVVATSEDGRHVLLATRREAARGDFRLGIDARLSAALRGELPRGDEAAGTGVTPKQIQARLRAGETSAQIAASAGVPVARVERFAGPVEGERDRMIKGAQRAYVSRSRIGPSALPMGEAVAQHLAMSAGYRPESTVWSARRLEHGTWLVELSFVSRAKTRTGSWEFDPGTGDAIATDAASVLLAHVDGASARRSERSPARTAAPVAAAARPSARTTKPTRRSASQPSVAVRAQAPAPSRPAPTDVTAAHAETAADDGMRTVTRRATAPRAAAAPTRAGTAGSRQPAGSAPTATRRASGAAQAAGTASAAAGVRRDGRTRAGGAAAGGTRVDGVAAGGAKVDGVAAGTTGHRAAAAGVGKGGAKAGVAKADAQDRVARAGGTAGATKRGAKPGAARTGAAKAGASTVGTTSAGARKAGAARKGTTTAGTSAGRTRTRAGGIEAGSESVPAASAAAPSVQTRPARAKASGTRAADKSSTPVDERASDGLAQDRGPDTAVADHEAAHAAGMASAVPDGPTSPPVLRVVRPDTEEPSADPGGAPADQAVVRDEAVAEAEPAPEPPARPARRAAGGRATVPAWADVLFGAGPSTGAGEPDRDPD